MKTYPVELRQRIVDAVDQQLDTYELIAEQFSVHVSYVYKLLRQRRETGDLAPLPRGGGAVAKLGEEQLLMLAELVAAFPDATLEEYRGLLRRKARVEVSVSTVWRGLDLIAMPAKKSPAGRARRTLRRVPPGGVSS